MYNYWCRHSIYKIEYRHTFCCIYHIWKLFIMLRNEVHTGMWFYQREKYLCRSKSTQVNLTDKKRNSIVIHVNHALLEELKRFWFQIPLQLTFPQRNKSSNNCLFFSILCKHKIFCPISLLSSRFQLIKTDEFKNCIYMTTNKFITILILFIIFFCVRKDKPKFTFNP